MKAVETQNYNDDRANVDKHMGSVIKDMKALLKTITKNEREIIKIEGSGSARLKDLDKRFQEIHAKYKAKNNQDKGAKKDMFVNKGSASFPKRAWTIEHTEAEGDKRWSITIDLSHPTQEAEDIESILKKSYLAPTLQEYLEGVVNPSCLKEIKDDHIHSDERKEGKETDGKPVETDTGRGASKL